MKTMKMIKNLFAALLIIAAVGCEQHNDNENNQQTPAVAEPTVVMEVLGVSYDGFAISLTATNIERLAFMVVEGSEAPDAATILAEGMMIVDGEFMETFDESVFPWSGEFEPNSTVSVAAVGVNDTKQAYTSETITIPAMPMPEVTLALRDGSAGQDSLSFYLSSTNADVVKWVCIEEGSRDVTAEQVLANGKDAEPNSAESEIIVEGLKEDTAYAIYAAATCNIEGFEPVLSEKLSMRTAERMPVGYNLAEGTTAVATKSGSEGLDNYFIIFDHKDFGYTLRADFYTAGGSDFLPSGEYTLGSAAEGALSKNFTTFMFTPNDTEMTPFESGSITVVATPNEETREVAYEIEGTLYFANGDFVALAYSGLIAGIELPEPLPEDPEIPEGAEVFSPDPETKVPERLHTSNLVAGEYYIKFYNNRWDELTLDLTLDPAICNDGKDALPAGTYTMADGTIDGYSSISIYSPYYGEKFTEAELTVAVDGEEYEFTFLGTAGSGNNARVFYMHYKGEIKDMVQ